MKTQIKKALTALALAVGFTTAATAAIPELVWQGNASTADKALSKAVEKGKPFTLIVHMTNTTATAAGSYIINKVNAGQTITPFCVAADEYTGFTTGGAIPNNSVSYDEKKSGGWWCGVGSRSNSGNATWKEEKISDEVSKLSSIYAAYSGTVNADGTVANCVRMIFAHKTSGVDYTLSDTAASLTISDSLDTMNVKSDVGDLAFKVYLDYTARTVDQIKQAIDDIENPKTVYTAMVTAATDWSKIVWEPAIEEPAGAELELTVENNATITLDGSFAYNKVTIKGDATFVAEDSVYEDGCWIKTLLGGVLTASGTISFGDVKSGFKGAYAKTATGITLRAQNKEVISINFANGNSVSGADYVGLAPVQGNTWMNMTTTWASDGKTVDLGTIKVTADGVNTTDRTDMSGSCYAANTYGYDATEQFLKGYLDDGGNRAQVNVNNIPYSTYDLIVYGATDTNGRGFDGVSVNGTTYTCGADGVGILGDAKWGQSLVKTAQYGVNAMIVKGLSLANLAIVGGSNNGTKGTRGGIAAVQIVCTGEVVEGKDFTATITESTDFSEIEWNGGVTLEEGSFNTATITIGEGDGEVTITFDNSDLSLKMIKIVSEERDVKLVAESRLSKVSTFDVSESMSKITYAWPVTSLSTAENANIAFAGGTAGETAIGIAHGAENTTLNLTGGTYKLSETHSDVDVTYNVTDSILNYPDCIGLGKGTYNVGGSSVINALKFVLVQGKGNSDSFNLTGDAVVMVSGSVISDSNQNTVMFGHWAGDSTFTIQDNAAFNAPNTQILIGKTGGNHTINANGGTISTKGIYTSSLASGTNELNLNGGILVLGEIGITGSQPLAVNVTADSTITSTAAMLITQPIVIDAGTTLTLDATDGDIIVSGAVTGEGTIKVVGGNVTFMDTTGVSPERVTVVSGKAFYGFTVGINECGTFKLTEGLTADNVKLYDKAGSEVAFEPDGKGNLTFEWKYTEGACWWDYEFNEASGVTPKNSGADKTALSLDGDRAQSLKDAGEYATNIVQQGEVAVTNISLRVPNRPWRDVSNWPATATFMFYGKMVGTDKAYQIAFGSKNNSGNQLFVATKSVADGTVDLCYSVKGAEPTVLCTMNVPNAQDADHLYAFVLKSDDLGNTVVNTFLDGKLLQPYTHDGVLTLGGGFQIASGHGGCAAGGYDRPANNDPATIDWLRVYDVELSAEVMEKLADIYPYISTNGKATRTVGATDTTWVSDGAWTQASFGGAETTQSAPNANTMVELTVSADTTLALNLDAQANYETLEIRGESALTLTGSEGSVVPSVSGATTIGTDVTVAYDAIKFGNVTVADGKTLTFDCAELDISKEFACRSIKLTGVATLGEGAQVVPSNLPEATAGRTVEFVLDGATGQYQLKIAVEEHPFVITVEEGATTGMWTWNGQPVDVATVEANPTVLIEKQGEGTYEATITRAYCVKEGMLKVQDYTGTPTITVEGGVFDINGKSDKAFRVVLAGGRLVNNGNAITTGSLQFTSIAQTADSEIGGTGEFGYILKGWGVNTLDLGGAKLTKTGDNVFSLCNCTVQNGALEVAGGTLRISDRDVTIAEDATLTIGADGTLDVKKILTADTLEGAGQVVLDASTTNEVGTLTGTLTITGVGVIKVLEKADYAIISTNVTLAAQAAVYFPAGVTHARKDFASKLAHEGAISIDAAEGAEFAGTFVFPKAEEITFTEAFTKAIKAAGYVKRETANEVIYFKPTVITIR